MEVTGPVEVHKTKEEGPGAGFEERAPGLKSAPESGPSSALLSNYVASSNSLLFLWPSGYIQMAVPEAYSSQF